MRSTMLALALLVACQVKPPSGTETATAPALPAARPAPAPAPAPALPADDPCSKLCDRARALACPHGEGCAANCAEMRRLPTCAAEMAAVLRCFEREPLAHWECTPDGQPAIKDGYCDREQGRFVTCAEKNAGPPPRPPRTGG